MAIWFLHQSLTTGVNIYESNSFKVADIDQNEKWILLFLKATIIEKRCVGLFG